MSIAAANTTNHPRQTIQPEFPHADKTPLRIALYDRHSTIMQAVTFSAGQAAPCMKLVDHLGGMVVLTYLGPGTVWLSTRPTGAEEAAA